MVSGELRGRWSVQFGGWLLSCGVDHSREAVTLHFGFCPSQTNIWAASDFRFIQVPVLDFSRRLEQSEVAPANCTPSIGVNLHYVGVEWLFSKDTHGCFWRQSEGPSEADRKEQDDSSRVRDDNRPGKPKSDRNYDKDYKFEARQRLPLPSHVGIVRWIGE